MQIDIVSVKLQDLSTLQNLSIQTFSETFSAHNSEINLKKYLDAAYATEKLLDELKNPDSQFFFAMHEQRAIGYLKVNFGQSQTELQDSSALEIERIYVLKEFHGKKIGQILYNKAMEIAKQMQVAYIWLGVWEKNHRALAFYKKNGFEAFDTHIFKMGDENQTDIMMKLAVSQ